MNIIKIGDIFVFRVESKYGCIQVIEKSHVVGYHVRVFCDLIDKIDDNLIKINADNSSFYYLKSFYEYTLLNKSEYKLNYKNLNDVKMPKYMRTSERKLNGDLFWYIVDVSSGKVKKQYTSFNDELINLSPNNTWGIEYIKRRWLENFTLNTWDDNLENKWYLEYLKKYEPEKLSNFVAEAQNQTIIKDWTFNENMPTPLLIELKEHFTAFEKYLSNKKKNYNYVNEKITDLIKKLNSLNDKYNFISTQESEEILEYINYLLNLYQYDQYNKYVDMDKLRRW